jgi:hypothetical protein
VTQQFSGGSLSSSSSSDGGNLGGVITGTATVGSRSCQSTVGLSLTR